MTAREPAAQRLVGTGADSGTKGDQHAKQLAPESNLSPVVEGREYCPHCGSSLAPRRCKLVCGCGYFMSCAEF